MKVTDNVEALIKMLQLHDDVIRMAEAVSVRASTIGDADLAELSRILKQTQRLSKESLWSFFIRSFQEHDQVEQKIFEIERLEHSYFVAEDDAKVEICKEIRSAIKNA